MKNKPLAVVLLLVQALMLTIWLTFAPPELSDYPAFYAVARLWQKGEQPYSFENQCKEQEQFKRGGCLPFVHPPILLPLMSLTTSENFVASYWRWVAGSTVALLLCLIPLYRITRDVFVAIQALLWQPLAMSLGMGQDGTFVLAAILFWAWLLIERRDVLAGVCLSLAVIKPHFAIPLAIPLAFCRPKAFVAFAACAAALTLYSFALIGRDGFAGILEMTSIMSRDHTFGLWPDGMSNFAGILARSGASIRWSWIVFIVGIVGICMLWRRWGVNIRTISLALIITMFTAPHVHPWDIGPLAIPLALGGMWPLMASSTLLFLLMPYRLLHWGCYAIMMLGLLYLLGSLKVHRSAITTSAGNSDC
jgi:hypothetical protein